MRNYVRLILYWLFRVFEIRSKEGVLHFRRWRAIENRWFRVFLHEIYRPDQDQHRHSHPWSFASLILAGGYLESTGEGTTRKVLPWTWNVKKAEEFHKIEALLSGRTVSLVFALGPYREWGYSTERGFIEKDRYRDMKRAGEWAQAS